jgi:hypothetical protein
MPAAKRAAVRKTGSGGAPAGAAAPAVDPMQWWGALTQQFTELAAKAIKESSDAAKHLPAAAAAASGSTAAARTGAAPKPDKRAGAARRR